MKFRNAALTMFLTPLLWAGEGSTSFPLLLFPPDVRGLALGQTAGARHDDGSAGATNPATLGTLQRGEVLFARGQWAETIHPQTFLAAFPTLDYGGASLRISTLDMDPLEAYDPAGSPIGKVGAQDLVVEAAWGGRALSEWAWWGLGGGYAQQRLGNSTIDAPYLNAGGMVQLPPLRWISDINAGLSFRGWGPSPHEGERLPEEIRLGVSGQIQRVNVSFDLARPHNETVNLHSGLEYAAGGNTFFRFGYSDSLPNKNQLTYGVGFRIGELRLDYAFLPLGDLGDTHHLALCLRFGRLAEKHVERGENALRGDDPAQAVIHFGRALAAEPNNRRALRGLRAAEEQLRQQWADDKAR